MFMKDHAIPFCWITRIIQIPVVSSISGLLRHIILTQHDDVEILRIDFLKLSCIKHPLPLANHVVNARSKTRIISSVDLPLKYFFFI